jgi:glutathione peroxidase
MSLTTLQRLTLVAALSVPALVYAQEPAAPASPDAAHKKAAPDAAKDTLSVPVPDADAAPADDAAPKGGGGMGGRRGRGGAAGGDKAGASDKVAYDYELPGADGKGVPLSSFKGKTLLIVNLGRNSQYASQIAGLEKMQEKYKDQGLVVIGIPSNEFGAAEPGTDADIQKFYKVEDKVTFAVMAESKLTGDDALPFSQWLAKAALTETGPIHWNFTKFLIDKTGKPVVRIDPAVGPDSPEMQAIVLQVLEGRYKPPTGGAGPGGRRGGGGNAM